MRVTVLYGSCVAGSACILLLHDWVAWYVPPEPTQTISVALMGDWLRNLTSSKGEVRQV